VATTLAAPAGGMVASRVSTVVLNEDYHVHSTFSDGASTVQENLHAAERRGLTVLCLTDHVRRDTTWIGDFVAAVEPLRDRSSVQVLTGVETKILNQDGELDLPCDLAGIELILIADHQFPGPDGPVLPAEMAVLIGQGTVSGAEVITGLIDATAAALTRAARLARTARLTGTAALTGAAPTRQRTLIAHLFSVLPKMGLSESAVPASDLGRLARRARDTGALLEVNEKWGCPSARTVSAFASAGVPVVASTDSHHRDQVGVYAYVRRTLAQAAGRQG
jgi:putative hydrolase